MYDYFDPGYLQAVMANTEIPTYFCFIGYDAIQNFAIDSQKKNRPVLFYHYEPNLFHITHAGLFQRVFLPRSVPERVVLATGTFGENGFGKKTNNPVDVDFPMTKLTKYAASVLEGTPAEQLLSKFSLQELDMNDLLRKYLSSTTNTTEPDPIFRAACQWVQENYAVWSLWLDRLPICTFETHIRYSVSGCNSTKRVITFEWASPNSEDLALPYNCDGGMTALPPPLSTSRICAWITTDSTKWRDWIHAQPECDSSFYKYNVTECDSRAKRTVKYWWLLPDSKDISKSLECSGGVTLPGDVSVDCEYMPTTSPTIFTMLAAAGVLAAVLLGAIIFVFLERDKPIVKRSQYEMLILILIGGILICAAAVVYAGKPTKLLCAGRPVITSIGLTTIFGSLFVKSLRVYRVFMRSAMKRVTVTMTTMMKVLIVFFCVDVLILGAWLVMDFPEPTSSTTDAREFRGEVDRVTCKSSSFLFTAVLMFWKAMVLLLGLYLFFLIRNVSADFQESIWIFASSLIVLIACLVMLPLAYVVEMPAPIFYIFLSCTLLLSTLIVMAMMLAPKLFRLNDAARSSRYLVKTAGKTHALLPMNGNGSSSTLVSQQRGSLTQRSRTNTALVVPNRATTVGEVDTESTQH